MLSPSFFGLFAKGISIHYHLIRPIRLKYLFQVSCGIHLLRNVELLLNFSVKNFCGFKCKHILIEFLQHVAV